MRSDHLVIAFFASRSDADGAVRAIRAARPAGEEVSVLPKHVQAHADIGLTTTTKASEGAALGALAGGVVGAFVGALMAGGSLVAPGIGVVLAGPVVAAFALAGALGVLGAAIGTARGLCTPAYEARFLRDAVGAGGSLVAVPCGEGEVERLVMALRALGGRCVRRVRR